MATEGPDNVNVIEVSHVTKTLGGRDLVKDLTFEIGQGRLVGLIGPSGGGKTTTVRLLVGIYAPTSGEVRVLGADPTRFSGQQRERVGYMPQHFFLQPTLTAAENLSFVAPLYGIGWLKRRKLIPRLLHDVELWDARHRLAKDLSGGMLRRLQLAAVMLPEPSLMFVDEPMAGLDPLLRERMWQILDGQRQRGATIVITTQITQEAERCDGVMLIKDGQIVANGTPEELRRHALGGEAARLLVRERLPEAMALLWSARGVSEVTLDGERAIRIVTNQDHDTLDQAVESLRRRGIAVESVEKATPSFDEVFERLVRGV
jgi:ABC-2 type transport system ATP-binding protein